VRLRLHATGARERDVDEATKREGKFIGLIEPYDYGFRATIRTLTPGAVFTEEGESKVFAKEPDAVKWLHTEASRLGFTSITIRNKSGD
jgi:hypothetical protein